MLQYRESSRDGMALGSPAKGGKGNHQAYSDINDDGDHSPMRPTLSLSFRVPFYFPFLKIPGNSPYTLSLDHALHGRLLLLGKQQKHDFAIFPALSADFLKSPISILSTR